MRDLKFQAGGPGVFWGVLGGQWVSLGGWGGILSSWRGSCMEFWGPSCNLPLPISPQSNPIGTPGTP